VNAQLVMVERPALRLALLHLMVIVMQVFIAHLAHGLLDLMIVSQQKN
jgi:hypothetical protein